MTKTAYTIPVPRGVRKDWEVASMTLKGAGDVLRGYLVPRSWEEPANCVAWFDRFGRLRLVVGHYPNNRSATVRIDANGVWKTAFGEVSNG